MGDTDNKPLSSEALRALAHVCHTHRKTWKPSAKTLAILEENRRLRDAQEKAAASRALRHQSLPTW